MSPRSTLAPAETAALDGLDAIEAAQVRRCARVLLRRPLLRAEGPDGEALGTVRRYADRLGTVAIEDMRRGDHTHLPFGQGDMDVPAVLAALDGIGFDRLVCVELSRESPRAHQAIPEAIAYLRAHLP